MTRKSAAKLKVVKDDKKELRPIEEVFEEAKEMFALTVDTQIKLAARVDNLMNIRDFCRKFWGDQYDSKFNRDELHYLKNMQQVSINTYQKVRDKVDEFELVDFRATELKDYFADIIPASEDIKSLQDLCEAALIFMSVQPYGSKLIQLHQMMQDEFASRDIFDDGEIEKEENNG